MKVHLAVMQPRYLDLILAGRKTVESRFTRVRQAPHGRVAPGDRIFFKYASGSVAALTTVAWVKGCDACLAEEVQRLLAQYADALCLAPDFAARVRDTRYVTLMGLSDIRRLAPFSIAKRDRRPWVILAPPDLSPAAEPWQVQLWRLLADHGENPG